MSRAPLLLAASLLAWCVAPLAAQTCTATSCVAVSRVSVTVPKMMRLTLNQPATPAATSTHRDSEAAALIRSNTTWRLEISAAQDSAAAANDTCGSTVVTGGSTQGAWQRVEHPTTPGACRVVVRYTLVEG